LSSKLQAPLDFLTWVTRSGGISWNKGFHCFKQSDNSRSAWFCWFCSGNMWSNLYEQGKTWQDALCDILPDNMSMNWTSFPFQCPSPGVVKKHVYVEA
jgi:hypothetical protein